MDYDGDRALESLITFVEEQAKNDLKPKVKDSEEGSQVTFETPKDTHDEL
jgi:protein disulfide-isomerase A1